MYVTLHASRSATWSVHLDGHWPLCAWAKLFRQMLPSALLKFKGAMSLIALVFKTFSSSSFALWLVVPLQTCAQPYVVVNPKAGRGTYVVCQTVCETGKWELWELSFFIAPQTWVSAHLRETEGRQHRKPVSPSNYHHSHCWEELVFVRHCSVHDWWQTSSKQFRRTSFRR